MIQFTGIDPTRPWYKRLTVIGTLLFGAAQAAETTGQIPPGTTASAADLVKLVGGMLVTLGVYRQVAK